MENIHQFFLLVLGPLCLSAAVFLQMISRKEWSIEVVVFLTLVGVSSFFFSKVLPQSKPGYTEVTFGGLLLSFWSVVFLVVEFGEIDFRDSDSFDQ